VHANYNPELELSEQPHELLYWMHLHVQFPAAHRSGKMAVVGHTPQKDGNVLDGGHLICLDTYCVGDGWLTAMDLANRRIWQANKAGELRKDVTEL
jgi:serine/threonine protein phosphatase 1